VFCPGHFFAHFFSFIFFHLFFFHFLRSQTRTLYKPRGINYNLKQKKLRLREYITTEGTPIYQTIDLSPITQGALFSSLPEPERRFVLSRSGLVQIRRGGKLFSIGEKAERFYVLLEGEIRVAKPRNDGGEDEAARFTPGDTIGDFDFARQARYDARAEALTDSLLIMFPGFGLGMDDFIQEFPQAVSQILFSSIKMTAARIKETQQIILKNTIWLQKLQRRAYEDPGTGLWKQSFLTDEINQILEPPVALIMLKPDRFKILVDSRGHAAGDEAMIRLARVLRYHVRRIGRGWALRLKSNEAALVINHCDAALAEKITRDLAAAVSAIPPFPPGGDAPAYHFSATLCWGLFPEDETPWEALFDANYALLLETWRAGGDRILRFKKTAPPGGAGV
jgi:GGDEF domain-containing protein